MKNHHNTNDRMPPGWDERRVRRVIDHYENQTPDERVAEIENAAIADGWLRIEEAIKEFNKINQSQLHKLKGQRKLCLLNWRGDDDEGPFDLDYTICLAAQLPAMDQPFRPVLCTISKRLKPAASFPNSKKKLLEILTACVDGTRIDIKKKNRGIAFSGISTAIYPKALDARSLCDALIRLEHSFRNVRDRLESKKSAS